MYAWARPRIAIPTHGERRHLREHAAFARDLQVPQTVAPRNGEMVRLAPGRAEVIDEVPAGRIYLDGGFMTPEDGEPLRERRHAATSGVLHAALVMDGRGRIASGPRSGQLDCRGIRSVPLRIFSTISPTPQKRPYDVSTAISARSTLKSRRRCPAPSRRRPSASGAAVRSSSRRF